ncbi:MAG: hypothetical protein ACT443_11995 [Gemmatimonadota bacterium]
MSKTFSDDNLLVWEAYPSSNDLGEAENPHIVFNCLTNRLRRPRWLDCEGNVAAAEKVVAEANQNELLALFRRSVEID